MKSGWPFVFLSLSIVAAAFAVIGSGLPIGGVALSLLYIFLAFFVASLLKR